MATQGCVPYPQPSAGLRPPDPRLGPPSPQPLLFLMVKLLLLPGSCWLLSAHRTGLSPHLLLPSPPGPWRPHLESSTPSTPERPRPSTPPWAALGLGELRWPSCWSPWWEQVESSVRCDQPSAVSGEGRGPTAVDAEHRCLQGVLDATTAFGELKIIFKYVKTYCDTRRASSEQECPRAHQLLCPAHCHWTLSRVTKTIQAFGSPHPVHLGLVLSSWLGARAGQQREAPTILPLVPLAWGLSWVPRKPQRLEPPGGESLPLKPLAVLGAALPCSPRPPGDLPSLVSGKPLGPESAAHSRGPDGWPGLAPGCPAQFEFRAPATRAMLVVCARNIQNTCTDSLITVHVRLRDSPARCVLPGSPSSGRVWREQRKVLEPDQGAGAVRGLGGPGPAQTQVCSHFHFPKPALLAVVPCHPTHPGQVCDSTYSRESQVCAAHLQLCHEDLRCQASSSTDVSQPHVPGNGRAQG